MERIILNEENYKIWSTLIMGELEDANLEHTIASNNNTTEGAGDETLSINIISAKDDSRAKRIIYKHLSEKTWTKVEDIDTAYELWKFLKVYYCETDEEKIKKYKKNLEELEYNGEEIRLFIADFENLWNKYEKAVSNIDPLSKATKNTNKLYYLRKSFKKNYSDIYERLTYSVVKEEDISIMKQIIELSLKEREINKFSNEEQKQKVNHFNHYYNAEPAYKRNYNTEPVYKKKCLLCGSTEHLINQCIMKDSFNNWRKTEQEKLKGKEIGKIYNTEENYNIEANEGNVNENNSF